MRRPWPLTNLGSATRWNARWDCSRPPSDKTSTKCRPETKTPALAGVFVCLQCRGLFLADRQTVKHLLEARQTAATIHQLLIAAGPGRVRLRIDVEMQGVTLLSPGAPGAELGAVGHFDGDRVIFGMRVGLHVRGPAAVTAVGIWLDLRGSIQDGTGPDKTLAGQVWLQLPVRRGRARPGAAEIRDGTGI